MPSKGIPQRYPIGMTEYELTVLKKILLNQELVSHEKQVPARLLGMVDAVLAWIVQETPVKPLTKDFVKKVDTFGDIS